MSSWDYSRIGLMFDGKVNDEKMVRDAMECLGFKEIEDLYILDTGVKGPKWKTTESSCFINYDNEDEVEVDDIMYVLNVLFTDIYIYSVIAKGNDTSDFYSGFELTCDMSKSKQIGRDFNYCYSNNIAWGQRVKESELLKKGVLQCTYKFDKGEFEDKVSAKMLETMLDNCEKRGLDFLADKIKAIQENRNKKPLFKKGIKHIKISEFENRIDLIEVVIPEGVVSIGFDAFKGCENLEKVVIPQSVEDVHYTTFEDTPFMRKLAAENNGFVIVNNILATYIGTDKNVVIPDNVKKISWGALEYNENIETLFIPQSVKEIGRYACKGCSNLREVIIDDTNVNMDELIFDHCTSLENVIVGKSVKKIPKNCFYDCPNIKKIEILNPECVLGSKVFGSLIYGAYYPEVLYETSPDIPARMSEADVVGYIKWDKVIKEIQARMLMTIGGKIINPYYEKYVDRAMVNEYAGMMKEMITEKEPLKTYNGVTNFLLLFADNISDENYKILSNWIKANPKAKKAIDLLTKNKMIEKR